jgi:hypothetical protein
MEKGNDMHGGKKTAKRLVALAGLIVLFSLGIGGGAWALRDETGPGVSLHGALAITFGCAGSLLLGGGLMGLAFFSSRSGHDHRVQGQGPDGHQR